MMIEIKQGKQRDVFRTINGHKLYLDFFASFAFLAVRQEDLTAKFAKSAKDMYKLVWLGLLALIITSGCSSKQAVPAESIKVLAAVRTAVSLKSEKQIERCREAVKAEMEKGRMSEGLVRELESVFALTDDGKWEQADKAIVKIQSRYKPVQAMEHGHSCEH